MADYKKWYRFYTNYSDIAHAPAFYSAASSPVACSTTTPSAVSIFHHHLFRQCLLCFICRSLLSSAVATVLEASLAHRAFVASARLSFSRLVSVLFLFILLKNYGSYLVRSEFQLRTAWFVSTS